MGKKYYIPNFQQYQKQLSCSEVVPMKLVKNNLIELENDEEIQSVIQGIEKFEYVTDKEVKEFFDTNLPEISRRITSVPIRIDELKSAFRAIFSELPDDLFEGDDPLSIIKKVMNFVFRKKEITFIILNFKNGKLLFNDTFKHYPTAEFYFNMMKLSYDLETYYTTVCDSQEAIQTVFLRQILFSNKKLEKDDINILNQVMNLSGNRLLDLREKMNALLREIREHKTFIKRTTLPVPMEYYTQEKETTEKINTTISDIDIRIQKIKEAKKIIEEQIKKNRGLLSMENAKYLIGLVVEL